MMNIPCDRDFLPQSPRLYRSRHATTHTTVWTRRICGFNIIVSMTFCGAVQFHHGDTLHGYSLI